MFASRSDLLRNSNARRLMQLAVPTDRKMPVDDALLRIAIEGGDLSTVSSEDQETLTLALEAIDAALVDASDLIVGYKIPEDAQATILTRLACNIALYFLQGSEREKDTVTKTYEGAIRLLELHAKGTMSLIPDATVLPEEIGLGAEISSNQPRFGSSAIDDDLWF